MVLFSNANHSFVWMDDAKKEKSPGIVITLLGFLVSETLYFQLLIIYCIMCMANFWDIQNIGRIFNKFRNRFLKESGHCGLNPLFVSISLYVLYTDYLF